MPRKLCKFGGCLARSWAHGLCPAHLRQYKLGQELKPIKKPWRPHDGKCTFTGCKKPHVAKGLCCGHWTQQRKGLKLTPIRTDETIEERFFRQTHVEEETGCWIFTGNGKGSGKKTGGKGYGQLYHSGTKCMAHRWSYEYFYRKLLPEEQVDHVCRNTQCVNPTHLEPVSAYENMRRLRFAKFLQARVDKLELFIRELGEEVPE